ncbi:hypothetical protein LCGC14_1112380 [marine sediment metagenome]|uniref:Uncharacterized protein n=1 Tax=marine sediment metagenome TaxID=412755 RepID=A0A0F9MB47_9ZZZZ
MASGDTLVTLLPQNNEPPAATFATLDTINSTSPQMVLDFALTEIGIWTFILPRHYAGGGIIIPYIYAMSSATSLQTKMTSEIATFGDGVSILTDSFAAVQDTGDITVPGTAGLVDYVSTLTHTDGAQMDNAIVGNICRLRLVRVAATADAAGDLEMIAIEIKEA